MTTNDVFDSICEVGEYIGMWAISGNSAPFRPLVLFSLFSNYKSQSCHHGLKIITTPHIKIVYSEAIIKQTVAVHQE